MRNLWLLLALLPLTLSAQTVTLTASPTAGVGTATPSLTWTASVASSCTASGGWTGTKAATGGTQVQPTITNTTTSPISVTYTLTCNGATGTAVLSWNPPTQNTDGSPLTNLGYYRVQHAATSAGVAGATPGSQLPAPLSMTSVPGVPVGPVFFGIKAYTSATPAVASSLSTIATTTIVGMQAIVSATVTVAPAVVLPPNPPTGLTVTELTAYDIRQDWRGRLVAKRIGIVPRGVACLDRFATVEGVKYNEIEVAKADMIDWPATVSEKTWARCG